MITLTDKELQKLKLNKRVVSQLKDKSKPAPIKQVDNSFKATEALTKAVNMLIKSINLDISTKALTEKNNKPLVDAIKALQKAQEQLDKALSTAQPEREKQEWVFTVERTNNGFINKIIAKEGK